MLCLLEVDVVSGRDLDGVWHEVVLDGRVDLHDVAALAAHVDVVDQRVLVDIERPLAYSERVRSVQHAYTYVRCTLYSYAVHREQATHFV